MYITMKLKLKVKLKTNLWHNSCVLQIHTSYFIFLFITLLLRTECIYLNLVHWWAKTMIANNTNTFSQAALCLFVKSTLFPTFFKALSFIYFLQSKSNSAFTQSIFFSYTSYSRTRNRLYLWIAASIVASVQIFCTEGAPLRVPGWLLILYQILLSPK